MNKLKSSTGIENFTITQRGQYLLHTFTAELNDSKLASKIMTTFFTAMLLITAATVLQNVGLAEGSDFTTGVKAIAGNLYAQIAGVSTVLAVVGETIAASMYFFSANGKTVEAASSWMKRIGLGWLCINGMGLLVNFLTGLTGGNTYQWK